MDRETIVKGRRRRRRRRRRREKESGSSSVERRWWWSVAVCRQREREAQGVRVPVEWPELDSTWTTYFYIAREIMGFPSWSGFPSGASGHRCTRQEILQPPSPPYPIGLLQPSRTFIVMVYPRSFTCLISPTLARNNGRCHNGWRVRLIFRGARDIVCHCSRYEVFFARERWSRFVLFAEIANESRRDDSLGDGDECQRRKTIY